MASVAIMVGIQVGAMALNYLLAKRVKQPAQHKNQFPDLQISTSDQGQFIAWGRGIVRVPANVVWSSGIREYTRQSSGGSGGKGGTSPGSGGTVIEHIYQTSVALLCTDCSQYPINRFIRVMADNETLFLEGTTPVEQVFEAEDATLAGGASVVVDGTAHGGEYVTGLGNGGSVEFDFLNMEADLLPDEPPDILPVTRITVYYKSNATVNVRFTVNGGTPVTKSLVDTDNEWAAYVYNFHGSTADEWAETLIIDNPSSAVPDIDYVTVFRDWTAAHITEYPRATGAIDPQIIYPTDRDDPQPFYNQKAVYDADGSAVINTPIPGFQMRFYTGTTTQMPDPAIVAWAEERFGEDGADYVSAYRQFSYIVLENLTLKNGRMPNFTVELDAGRNEVSELTEDIYDLVNVESSDLDLDALADLPVTTVDGMLVYQFTPAAELIKKLETWFNFRMVEIDGVIRAVSETGSPVATIPKEDLKAHDFGEEMPAYEADHPLGDEKSLPNEIIVSAMDANQDYHANPQSEQLFASTVAREPIEMSFPFVSTPDEMKRVSNTQVSKIHLESKPYIFSAMPKWGKLTPGDKINLELSTRTVEVKITKKSMALVGRSQFEAVLHNNYIYDQTVSRGTRRRAHSLRSELESLPQYPRNSKLVVIESIPILREHRGELGVYMAVSGRGVGRWNGATIYRDTGDGNFEPISVVDAPSPIGVCQDTLGDWSPVSDVDTTNEVTIYFYDDVALENVTEAEARENPALNLIRIGGEWLQFLTAVSVAVPESEVYRSGWTVSDFLRGKFDTEPEVGSHGADEITVVVTSALKWRRFETPEIGTTIDLKAVTNGQAVEYAETVSFTLSGLSIQPTPKTDVYSVTLYDDLRTFSNEGATGEVPFSLPEIGAADGFKVSFFVAVAETMEITAFPGEQIFLGDSGNGTLESAAVGSFVTLKSMNGAWIAQNVTGDWALI